MKLFSRLFGHKKILAIMLSIIVLAGFLVPVTATPVAATAVATIYMAGTPQSQSAGDDFTVQIKLDSTVAINGWQFSATWDPNVLTCTSATEDSWFSAPLQSFGLQGDATGTPGLAYKLADSLKSSASISGPISGLNIVKLNFHAAQGLSNVAAAIHPVLDDLRLTTTNGAPLTGGDHTGGYIVFGTVPAPAISTVAANSPHVGAANHVGNGTIVTITGTNLTGADIVKFGGSSGVAAQSFTVTDDTHITATVGGGSTGAVYVHTALGTGQGGASVDGSSPSVTWYAAPTVTSPTTGSPVSGHTSDSIHIVGTNFVNGETNVSLGGHDVTSGITANTGTDITVTVGSGTTGNVVVATAGGSVTVTSGFILLITPTITSVTDQSGNAITGGGPGTPIRINGTHLLGLISSHAVTFSDGTHSADAAQNDSRNTDTAIYTSVPVVTGASTGSLTITVTTAGGSATSAFAYQAAGVTGFAPTTAYTGDTVTINGTGFYGGGSASVVTAVSFGGVAAQSINVLSDTKILAVVANGNSGSVSVTLSTISDPLTRTGFTYRHVALSIVPMTQSVDASSSSTFTVSLNINTNGNSGGDKQVRGWQTDITFNPALIHVDSITQGTFLSSFCTISNNGSTTFGYANASLADINATGKIDALYCGILGAADAGGATGQGTLAVLTCHALANGTSDILLSNVIVSDGGNPPKPVTQLTLANSSVSITGSQYGSYSAGVPVDAGLGAELTFIPPAPVSGWNLVVSQNNNVQRTLNVFSNADWQVTVFDNSITTAGHLTKYSNSAYTASTKLSNPLEISSSTAFSGLGSSAYTSLATGGVLANGTPAGQNQANGGDIRNVMLNQTVTYVDPIVTSPYTYHMVITFTASNTDY